MDMVKGAIFSSLADAVPGARVLDLFAGSGGLGIEALSRGAASAVFVEEDWRACQCIEENLRKTRLSGAIRKADVFHFLKPDALPWKAHLIFADPPYAKGPDLPDLAAKLVRSPHLPQLADPEACLILEVASGWQLPADGHWQGARRKNYGSTDILFLHALPPASLPGPCA
jgi:16S rRNA (guanine966-N2)-methyltransferase